VTDPDAIAAAELERVSALRMQMLQLHPFWGYLLLQVRIVPAPDLECLAATDCVRHIWFNPERTRHLSNAQLGFVLAHEVGHQLYATADRRRGRNPQLWNCATDYAINRIVAAIEHPARYGAPLYDPPQGDIPGLGEIRILLDPRWDGKIAEAIYEYLAADELPDPVSVTLSLDLDGRITVPNLTDHGGGIDIHLPEDLTPAQRDELHGRITAAVEAWSRAPRRGDMPADLVREITGAGRARVPWQRLFRRFTGQATARDEYSLTRPNRRYLAHDLLVPGLHSDRAGEVIVAVDTSGSIHPDQLEAIAAELHALEQTVEHMTLLVADAKLQQVVEDADVPAFLRERQLRGGGGTDHRPVFHWIAEHHRHPDLFIGLTDLYTRLPDRRPPFPVLWVVPEDHGDAPWGTVVDCSP
jgi:predicted metal-dependent peptidase